MKEYNGNLKTRVFWIVPFLIAVSKSKINDGTPIFSLHLTPFIEISFSHLGTRNGSEYNDVLI